MKAWGALTAWFDLREAEARTGIALVEAVAADQFETQLRMLDSTPEGRADIREAALNVAKLGLRSEDLEPMARSWYLAHHRFEQLARRAEGFRDEFTAKGTR